jgi:GT2 family glycosyltransferase
MNEGVDIEQMITTERTNATAYPRVGIVLVNFNGYADTKRCLESLETMTYPNAEIIVVDNGSADGSGERIRAEFPSVTHIRSEENTGFTGGNNIGIEHAMANSCDHALLLNNDTIITPNFLEPLIERLESNPKIAAVSGKIYYTPEKRNGQSDIIWYAGCYQKWHTGYAHTGVEEKDTGKYDTPRKVPYACGCLMLMRGSLIKQIGMLSKDYFIYWEEADWCMRAHNVRYFCMYEPRSVIYHNLAGAPIGDETPFFMYLQHRNAFIYAKKYYHGLTALRFWLFYPLFLAYRFLYDWKIGKRQAAIAMLKGVRDYFKGYTGTRGLEQFIHRKLAER